MSTENILAIYEQATEAEKAAGIAWYKEARSFCRKQAQEYGVSLEVVVAVISALSPRNKWEQNLKDAVTVLEAVRQGKGPDDVKVSTFGKNKVKAFNIVLNHKPSLVKASSKTAAFFDNIRYENSKEVTVDVHAFGIYMGVKIPVTGLTPKKYAEIAEAYRQVAEQAKLLPYQIQAITWVTWKRLVKEGKQLSFTMD